MYVTNEYTHEDILWQAQQRIWKGREKKEENLPMEKTVKKRMEAAQHKRTKQT